MTTSTLSRIGIPPAPGRSTRPIPASGSRSSLWASPPWSHPELTFRSKAIEPVDEDTFRVIGDLSINGVTNDVELTAGLGGIETGPEGEKRLGLEVSGQVSRTALAMKFIAALGSALVADKVKIVIDVTAVKRAY